MGLPALPGIKIGDRMSPAATDAEIDFFLRMGIECATIWTTIEDANLDFMRRTRARLEGHGIRLWNVGILDLHCDPTMVLGLPGFERKVEQYVEYLENLGKAGIGYTTYAHMANIKMLPYYQTSVGRTRGSIPTREFDLDIASTYPDSHGRKYGEDEVWETFARLMAAAVPAAERSGVRIGLHPDDPPVPVLGGVGRAIRSFEGYQRALAIADSPNVGLCFCVGSWAEGGDQLGCDVPGMIEHFGRLGKIFKVHFRNVDAPMPVFRETMVDDGYVDMHAVMTALEAVGFDGVLIPDHVPGDGADKTNSAYTIGYMRAIRHRVLVEAGRRASA